MKEQYLFLWCCNCEFVSTWRKWPCNQKRAYSTACVNIKRSPIQFRNVRFNLQFNLQFTVFRYKQEKLLFLLHGPLFSVRFTFTIGTLCLKWFTCGPCKINQKLWRITLVCYLFVRGLENYFKGSAKVLMSVAVISLTYPYWNV